MEKIKILHCADWHLGSSLWSIPEHAAQRAVELLGSFRRMTRLCQKEQVDLLLIAGDLFEGTNIDPAVVASVKEYLADISSRVFIAPGNHDYAALDSPFLDSDWPDNVHIFRGGLERVDLPDLPVSVYGAAFTGSRQQEVLLPQSDPNCAGRIRLGVFHADVVGTGQSSGYHGIQPEQIRATGLDYLALGHIHQCSGIQRVGHTTWAYPGIPDGRGFDETGRKGVYLGTVQAGAADLQFESLSSRQYLIEPVDVSGFRTEAQAEAAILAQLKERHGDSYADHFYRIRLTGRVGLETVLPWTVIENRLAETLHYVQLLDETRMEVDFDNLAQETSLRGIFVRKMLEAGAGADEAQKNRMRQALEAGLRALEGQVIDCDH
ncbi:MAG: DNA repair exonuclease [Clostridiaceae bacterium]